MFRENVLIALTILITILALSFVILMTVYFQIHEMDRKWKALENLSKKEEQAKVKYVTVDEEDNEELRRHQELIKRAEAFWSGIREGNGEQPNKDQGFRPFVFGSITFKEPSTEKPSHGGKGRAASSDFYKGTGHVPEVDDSANPDILTQVLTEIQEYEMRKRMQEIESSILGMNDVNRNRPWYKDRITYYRGGAKAEDGRIWFTKDTTQGVATTIPESSSLDSNGNGDTD